MICELQLITTASKSFKENICVMQQCFDLKERECEKERKKEKKSAVLSAGKAFSDSLRSLSK